MSDTFPRQHARTQRLTLGEPRGLTVSPDGTRVVFARSGAGSDPVNMLWVLDTATGEERLVLDPRTLGGDGGETAEELRRRERAREGAGGVVTCAFDADVRRAVTVLGGQVVIVDLLTSTVSLPLVAPGVFDPRLSPDGGALAYVRGGSLCISSLAGDERVLASDDDPDVSWGSAEFIAAEEMGRPRGYWWSPDGTRIAACRVDAAGVEKWWIADPSRPGEEPSAHRYPAAGTPNAVVDLHVIDVATTTAVRVDLPGGFEYLTSVSWTRTGLVAQVQTRDQRRTEVHRIDPVTGTTARIGAHEDPAWVELVPGVPALDDEGRLVTCGEHGGTRRVEVDGTPVTPGHLQVRSVVSGGAPVVFVANEVATPWVVNVYRVSPGDEPENLAACAGVVSAAVGGDTVVTRTSTLDARRAAFAVHRDGRTRTIANLAETPLVQPNVRIVRVGEPGIPVAILTPRDGSRAPLPVLFDPYGGPHAQRVLASTAAFTTSQWFADQGFVVVVADGRGTPGLGSKWERAVYGDLAGPVLADQVAVAAALAGIEPRADLSRVAIRGWSFGGYLAALAVLRAPEVFHAGIAGAPVTDWRLYDTHYTERYLGNPSVDAAPYARSSIIDDAHLLRRPLLLIHGLADDNVVAAHTLGLSAALLAAGAEHEVLPLSGVTHMTPQETVAENLLLRQLSFLRRSLG